MLKVTMMKTPSHLRTDPREEMEVLLLCGLRILARLQFPLRPDQFYLLVLASRRHLVAKNANKNKMLFYFYFGCRPPRICHWENKMTLEIKSQHIISWSVASYSRLLTPVGVSPRVGLPAFVFCSQLALQVISIIAHTQANLAWTSEYLQSQP